MAKKQQDLLVAWLKDAYVMEKSLIKTMEVAAKEAKEYPEIQEKIEEHIEVTESQAERLKERLEELGEEVLSLKTMGGEIMGKMQGYGTKFAEDKIVKNSLIQAAGEAFEIACYSALMQAAENLGDTKTAELAETIKEEELEMQAWLEENLPNLIDMFFAEKESEEMDEEVEAAADDDIEETEEVADDEVPGTDAEEE